MRPTRPTVARIEQHSPVVHAVSVITRCHWALADQPRDRVGPRSDDALGKRDEPGSPLLSSQSFGTRNVNSTSSHVKSREKPPIRDEIVPPNRETRPTLHIMSCHASTRGGSETRARSERLEADQDWIFPAQGRGEPIVVGRWLIVTLLVRDHDGRIAHITSRML